VTGQAAQGEGAACRNLEKSAIPPDLMKPLDFLRLRLRGGGGLRVDSRAPMRWIYWTGWLLFGAASRSLFGMRVKGAENLLTRGGVLVAANHQSYLDPPLVGNLYQDEMVYLARKSLFKGFFKWLYGQWNAIPVDQDKPDMASLKTIIRKLKEGHRVLVFPEGSRTVDGSLGEAAPGIGLVAVKSGVPIQPVRISGAREALPRGSARIRFSRITMSVGPPIILTPEERAAKSKDDYDRIARRIMDAIAALD
jgi:1-acyl-sn-glycerol-3-phosphate acyltransferase